MSTPPFDLRRLFHEVALEREHRGLSRKKLSREVGVAASTIRRLGDADDAEAARAGKKQLVTYGRSATRWPAWS